MPHEIAAVRALLLLAGLDDTSASTMLAQYSLDRIKRNINLHKHEKATSPAGYLIQAIRRDYAAEASAAPPPVPQPPSQAQVAARWEVEQAARKADYEQRTSLEERAKSEAARLRAFPHLAPPD
jgi:hypothetical protein